MHVLLPLIAYACAAAASAAPPDAVPVLVLPVQGPVADDERATLQARIAAAARAAGADVVDEQTARRFLEGAAALGTTCAADDVDCWLRVGVAGGVDHLLLPVVVEHAEARRLDLVALDVGARAARKAAPLPLAELDDDALQAALGAVLPRPPPAEPGALLVAARVAGARVLVDGVERGRTPLSAPLEAAPGTRVVAVERDGFRPVARVVEVPPGASIVVDVELDPVPAPPPAPAVVAGPPDLRVVGGVSALAAGGAAAALAGAGIAASEIAFATSTDAGARFMLRGATATLLAVAALGGAAAAVGGGALAWAVSDDDVSAAREETRPSPAPAATTAQRRGGPPTAPTR